MSDLSQLASFAADVVAELGRDELSELEDYLIAQANEVWLRDGGGRELSEEEQAWQRKLDVVQARMDELDERDYVPSPWVAEAEARARAANRRASAPHRGARARGAGRPAGRPVARRGPGRGGDSGDDGDGLADSDPPPPARPRRARRCGRGPPARRARLERGAARRRAHP